MWAMAGVQLVGWDGSREATRAVHAALPFLREAHRVVLCAVGEPAGAGLDDAALMLQRHGVQVEPERVAGSTAMPATSSRWRERRRTVPSCW